MKRKFLLIPIVVAALAAAAAYSMGGSIESRACKVPVP